MWPPPAPWPSSSWAITEKSRPHRLVWAASDCQKSPKYGAAKPFPRGEGGPRRGSEEECGRKTESQYNISDLLSGWVRERTLVKVFAYPKSKHDRPHSSSVRKSVLWDRFSDSFSPGEAISRCARDRSGGRYRGTVITVPYATEGHRGPEKYRYADFIHSIAELCGETGKNRRVSCG